MADDVSDPGTAEDRARVRLSGLAFRLDPTNVQAGILGRSAGARRYAFNSSIARITANQEVWAAQRDAEVAPGERVRPPSAFDLRAAWKAERPDWAGEISSWVFDFACREAAAAHRNYLAGRTRFPRFAKKGRSKDRFTVVGRDATLEAGRVRLPKIGWVRICGADPQQVNLRRLVRRGRARVTSVTVSRHADGSWWAAAKIERLLLAAPVAHAHAARPVVGVDRGVKTAAVAATAGGVQVAELASGRYLRDTARRLAHAQRTVARRTRRGQPSSANRAKAVARVGKLHAKVAAQRAAALHTFSSSLARDHPVIVLETLTTANLMANRHLAGAIGDQGWAELARQLAYKTEWRSGLVLRAPRMFPSSKTCSGCGAVKPTLSLSERTYLCATCGLIDDRDVNAGATLAAWGEHQLGVCPCVTTQVRDRHPGGRSDVQLPCSATRGRHACGGWVSVVSSAPRGAGVPMVPPVEAGTGQPHAA